MSARAHRSGTRRPLDIVHEPIPPRLASINARLMADLLADQRRRDIEEAYRTVIVPRPFIVGGGGDG